MSYESIAKRNHESALRIAEYREIAALSGIQDVREAAAANQVQCEVLRAERDALEAALKQLTHAIKTYGGFKQYPQAIATALVDSKHALALVVRK